MFDDNIPLSKKADLAADLLLLAPPCEVDEVLKDIRAIVGENPDAENKFIEALFHYAKEHNLPTSLPTSTHKTLITEHGDLGGGRFLCPRSHTSFALDPCTLTVNDIKTLEPNDNDGGSTEAEPWRHALEVAMTKYLEDHYPRGSLAVYAPAKLKPMQLVAYIEANHQKQLSTGRWRSCWTVCLPDKSEAIETTATGCIKLQTHIFEEGNVQLFASQDFKFTIDITNPEQFAQDFVKKIGSVDSEYQTAVGVHLQSMSTSAFKSLRRQLPITHSKLEWNKIATYQVGSEINRPN